MYTASDVMESAAALLNDKNRALYTFPVQLPYLKIALREVEDELTANESPLNLISELIVDVIAGDTSLALPVSFFLPISLQERSNASSNFSDMGEIKDVYQGDTDPSSTLNVWDYRHNCINFIAANQDRQVRLTYWRFLSEPIDELSPVVIRRGQNALAFRTAALCAEFAGGGNEARANSLNLQYGDSMDRLVSLVTKNNQGKRVRRKPFRLGMTR